MGFWIFMFFMDLLIPIIMLFFGVKFRKAGPKEINSLYGYRTSRSMKNKDTWQFAHQYCGKIWFYTGIILIPLSVIPLLFVIGKNEDTVGWVGAIICYVQMVPLLGSIFFVERALKKTFDKDGNRK